MGLFGGEKSGNDDFGILEHFGNQKKMLFGDNTAVQNPERNIIGLDDATQSLMKQKEDRANRSPEEIAAEMQRGVQQDSGAAFNDMGLMNQGMGGSNPMAGAIQNRASKNYLRDVNAIKRQAEYQAPITKQNEMQSVMQDRMAKASAAAGVADRDREQRLQNWQQEQNQIAARRKVITGIFQTGGTVAGAYFGGAAGAKAGNQAGASMGGNSSQSISQTGNENLDNSAYSNYK